MVTANRGHGSDASCIISRLSGKTHGETSVVSHDGNFPISITLCPRYYRCLVRTQSTISLHTKNIWKGIGLPRSRNSTKIRGNNKKTIIMEIKRGPNWAYFTSSSFGLTSYRYPTAYAITDVVSQSRAYFQLYVFFSYETPFGSNTLQTETFMFEFRYRRRTGGGFDSRLTPTVVTVMNLKYDIDIIINREIKKEFPFFITRDQRNTYAWWPSVISPSSKTRVIN